jgi:membrane protease YdiL (CAAX protease family)
MSSMQWAAAVGLLVGFGGMALLVSPASRLLGDPERLLTRVLGQLALWGLFVALLAIVIVWEKQPLSSLWLRPLAWRSLALGALFAAIQITLVYPVRSWLLELSGLPGFAAGTEKILALPLWFRILAVASAGVVEETVFHGYALTRLGTLLGGYWAAALIVVPAFALVHYPLWGAGPVLSFLVSGCVSAALFLWSCDLTAMIVCHILVDAMGLVVTPLYTDWWRNWR